MPNRLGESTSPYLLQHATNPVDWYPWCEEALQRSKEEDKPIFLSIGYSACHWCHVMEHESFENGEIASVLNEHFVPIKVDREQRPDLDQVYMQAVQMMTGSGGWPMSVFLTPEGKPFYGGTYWPPEPRWGRPGFKQVLLAVAEAWKVRRSEIEAQGEEMVGHLQESSISSSKGVMRDEWTIDDLGRADRALRNAFDSKYGGFGVAPKFPHAMDLDLLLRLQSREHSEERSRVILRTLDGMAAGGIYDHLGGGFSRYSVDERWLVPHFEKMLYDNALLAGVYLDAYRWSGQDRYRQVVEETLDYLLRDMRDPEGGFYSAEDADSEGIEGKFYVWSPAEVLEVLGPGRGARFCELYDVTHVGNFESESILNRLVDLGKEARDPESLLFRIAVREGISIDRLEQELREDRKKLLDVRACRIRPGLDDKILVSWNALAIDILARAGFQLDRPDYLEAARVAANFLLLKLKRNDGRLLHVWRRGKGEIDAFLDDYAYFANSLITLSQSDFDRRWLKEAIDLVGIMCRYFSDERGGFYFTAHDTESLIARTKDTMDHSIPSGSGMAATAMARLGILTSHSEWLDLAWGTLNASKDLIQKSPGAAGQLLIALDWLLGPSQQCVLFCAEEDIQRARIQEILKRSYQPHRLVMMFDPRDLPANDSLHSMLKDRSWRDPEKPVLYLCEGMACRAPIEGWDAIAAELPKKG